MCYIRFNLICLSPDDIISQPHCIVGSMPREEDVYYVVNVNSVHLLMVSKAWLSKVKGGVGGMIV